MTVIDLIRKKIMDDMVRYVDPPGRWKVMVVDAEAQRILNTVVKQSDLTDEHIISVEGLLKGRQPHPQREVIYFISPDPASIQRIVDDFSTGRPPYAAIHVFSSAPLPDSLFEKIKRSPASQHIRSMKELNLDFSAPESHVFTVDLPTSLKTAFNPQSPSLQNYELEKIGKRLASVLASLGEYPYIRYYDPHGGARTPNSNGKLANIVQAELDHLARIDKSFPPTTQYQRAILLIIDRSADIVTPLIHHFTYQAMVMDVLGCGDMVWRSEDGDVKLDQNDVVWNQARHWHIAEVMEFLGEEVKKFASENKAATFALNGSTSSGGSLDAIQKLKDTMAHLPQYQEMKTKYSIHTSICADAMSEYNHNKLERVSALEQDIAVGETSEGKTPRNPLSELLALMEDPHILHEDKLRLSMTYLIAQNGMPDADRQRLLDAARLSVEEAQAVHNLSMLGVRLSTPLSSSRHASQSASATAYGIRDRGKEHKFENTRFTPLLKYIMTDHVRSMADVNSFPWVKEPPPSERPSTWAAGAGGAGGGAAPAKSKASWANRRAVVSAAAAAGSAAGGVSNALPTDALRANGPRLITFVLGGVTASEMKACYDVMKDQQRELILGSTHILTPASFLDAMKDLHRHGPARPPRPLNTGPPVRQPRDQQPPTPQPRYGGAAPPQQDRPPSSASNNSSSSARPSLASRLAQSASRVAHRASPEPSPQTPPPPQPMARPPRGASSSTSRPGTAYASAPSVSSRVGNIEARMADMSVNDRDNGRDYGRDYARDGGRGGDGGGGGRYPEERYAGGGSRSGGSSRNHTPPDGYAPSGYGGGGGREPQYGRDRPPPPQQQYSSRSGYDREYNVPPPRDGGRDPRYDGGGREPRYDRDARGDPRGDPRYERDARPDPRYERDARDGGRDPRYDRGARYEPDPRDSARDQPRYERDDRDRRDAGGGGGSGGKETAAEKEKKKGWFSRGK
ncbi:Sec1-like protein [Geranomyces variabilis]|nr:Sec1-like protein [Geranomyces variabilis]KAJ3136081.1 vacuolar sorting protein VPS33/slp1 [Geranomyces variabilis]